MIGMMGKTLKSERLSYKLLGNIDVDSLKKILSDEGVCRFTGFLPPNGDDDFHELFMVITQFRSALGIYLDGKLIGYIRAVGLTMLSPEYSGKSCVNIGFVIAKEYQGQGFATEALSTFTSYLTERYDYCFADCFAENAASERVIIKCGYRFEEEYDMFFSGLGEKHCKSYVYGKNMLY